jgi:hypothetical protein
MTSLSMSTAPTISAVVVIFGGRACLPACLEALARQTGVDRFEVVVPCDDRIADVDVLERQFPQFHFIRLAGLHTYAELRTIGIKHSHAPLVAITEAQCTPCNEWLARLVAAHDSAHAVVGGTVDKTSGSPLSWAMYLSDYNRYMPPVPAGPASYLTDCNVSYKRDVLDAIKDVWAEEFHETSVHWKLQTQGKSLWLDPTVLVNHGRVLGIGEALADRYAFARLFASTRVAATSPAKRWIYAATSCLLPALFTLRAFKSVITKKRNVGRFFRALPALLMITTVWGFGEFCGYVTGNAAKSLTPRDKSHSHARVAAEASVPA